eukprot:5309700-Prymnesium_polylepis.1
MRTCNVWHVKESTPQHTNKPDCSRARGQSLRSSSSTAPLRTSLPPERPDRDQRPLCGLARHRSQARPHLADRSGLPVAGRAAPTVTGRRPWSPQRMVQPLDQTATAPLHKGVQMQARQSRAR